MSILTKSDCTSCHFVCCYTKKNIRHNCYIHFSTGNHEPIAVWYELVENNSQQFQYLSSWIDSDKNPDEPAYVCFVFAKIRGLIPDNILEKYPF